MTEQRSQEWHDERRTYLGASQMAAALALAPRTWGDPISVWEEKRGEGVPQEESFRMKLGTMAEPIIGRLASDALERKLRRVTGPVRHPDHSFLASNPDFRIIGERGLVQAKLRLDGHAFGAPDDSGSGESIPIHYRVQGLGELLTTGLDFVYFAVLDPFDGLSLHLLDRRAPGVADEIEDLRLDLVEWWQAYVVEGNLPPASAGSSEALARRFPKRVSTKIGLVASAGQEQVMQELLDVRADKAALEEQEEALKNRIKTMVGEAHYIEGAGHRFSWGETHRKTTDWKQVAGSYRYLLEHQRRVLEGEWDGKSPLLLEDLRLDPSGETEDPLDTIEGLYTTETDSRGPFTVAALK